MCRSAASCVVVKKVFRFGDVDVIEKRQLIWSGLPVSVRRFVLQHQHERFVFVAFLLKPLKPEVRCYICIVAFVCYFVSAFYELRVVVCSLAREDLVIVKAGWSGF